jgi:signal transduction histidine kinase
MPNSSPKQARALLARHQSLSQRQHKLLARKIHDEVSQKMTLLTLQLSLASTDDGPPTNWSDKCKEWAGVVMELGQSIRDITSELQPKIIDASGLTAGLRWFAQSAAANHCSFVAPENDVALNAFAANELFAICREMISDVLVPAGASPVEIKLEEQDDTVRLSLRVGESAPGSVPISEKTLETIALHDRMVCLDGSSALNHLPEGGCVVTLTLPISQPAACAA